MTLTLTLKETSKVPLEVEGITPDTVQSLSVAEIEKLSMFQGNVEIPLAEFFSVKGDASDAHMVWEGELAGVQWIGAQMASGRLEVKGDAGRHVGSEMSGGELSVSGNVSDWLGGEMKGGVIHVGGNAGHLVGAAYRGSRRGMTGGMLLVDGNAGNEIGHTMRRGLIAIGGDIGDVAGFNMLAGTILSAGNVGIRHGAGMRRGTLTFLGDERPPILSTFRYACRYRPDFMKLICRQLEQLKFKVASHWNDVEFDLYHGDMIDGGRGEMLFIAN